MQGIIGFKQLAISCIIGDFPEEWEQEQLIYVDLKVKADFSRCAQSDNLKDTVNYVQLAEICTQMAKTKKYRLLETFAYEVLERLLADFPLSWVWISVKKPAGIQSAQYTYVELEKDL
jgi:7,8-dihydroneopterin aldolase/epimerase/oxygenase